MALNCLFIMLRQRQKYTGDRQPTSRCGSVCRLYDLKTQNSETESLLFHTGMTGATISGCITLRCWRSRMIRQHFWLSQGEFIQMEGLMHGLYRLCLKCIPEGT